MHSLTTNDEFVVGKKGKPKPLAVDPITQSITAKCIPDEAQDICHYGEFALDYFREKEQVKDMIEYVCSEQARDCAPNTQIFIHLREISRIIELYREDPSIIYPHVAELLQPITHKVLLPSLRKTGFSTSSSINAFCSLIYVFASVASYKALTVNEVFPHSVHLLAPLIELASTISSTGWESQFVVYLWLSVVIMAPFELQALGLDPATTNERIYNVCVQGIGSARNPSVKKSASVLLSRFLARQNNLYLQKFLSSSPNISALNQVLKIVPSLSTHLESLWSNLSLPKNPTKHHLSVASSIAILQLQSTVSDPNESLTKIECLLNQILQLCVGNPSILIRESAAKAIGRICSHLVPEYIHQFLLYLLRGGKVTTDEFELHSILLIFGEICRRKNQILFFEFPSIDLINFIINGIEKERKNASIIRDSACALIWSIARSVGGFGKAESLIKSQFLSSIIPSLLTLSLFDKDVNMRRTGAAALQELIGRVGTKSFSSGLKILDLIDFWTISNIKESFTTIPKQLITNCCEIINGEKLRNHFLNHLWNEKVFVDGTEKIDWTTVLLATNAYATLINSNDFSERIREINEFIFSDSNPFRRVAAMGLLNSMINEQFFCSINDDETKSVIRNLIPLIEKRRLFREKFGDKMRIFSYHFLKNIFIYFSHLNFKNEEKYTEKVLEIINDGIIHLLPEVTRAAICAIVQLASIRTQAVVPLLESYIDQLESNTVEMNLCARRGMLSALVSIDHPQLAVRTTNLCVKEAISWPSHFTGNRDYIDPECRRIAVLYFAKHDSDTITKTLCSCLEDFQTDKRGDIGSWVRETAIEILIAKGYGQSVSVLVHQLERLDRVRDSVSSTMTYGEIFAKYHLPWMGAHAAPQLMMPTSSPEQTLAHLLTSRDLSVTDLEIICTHLVVCVGSQTPCVISNSIENFLVDFCESKDARRLLETIRRFIVDARKSTGRFSGKVDRINRIVIPSINTLTLLFQTVAKTKSQVDLDQLVVAIQHHIDSSNLPSILEVLLLKSVSKFLSQIIYFDTKYMKVFILKILMSKVPVIRVSGATDWIKAIVLAERNDMTTMDTLESTNWVSESKGDWFEAVKKLVNISCIEWDDEFENYKTEDTKVVRKSLTCDYAQFIQEEYRLS